MVQKALLTLLGLGAVVASPVDPIKTRACQPPHDQYPFCDTKRPLSERIDNLISLIDPAEKPLLLTARGWPQGNVHNLSKIGVPEFDWGLNCIHGVQSTCIGDRCPTSFPNPIGFGAMFNNSLVYQMGAIIGWEARALWLAGATEPSKWSGQAHIGLDCWSPNININRDPRWGRNMEVPSEDPLIAGEFGKWYTKGLQEGRDSRYLQVVVTLKHWDAYSLEDSDGFTRHNFDAQITPYDLTTTYFPAFKTAVTEGNAMGVMCSYNSVNGIPTCASPFLTNVLRNQWNFTGYITSDTGAIGDIYQGSGHRYTKTAEEAVCKAIVDGSCDIDSGPEYWQHLHNATVLGYCAGADVDRALRHTLGLRFRLGLFDPIDNQPYWHVPISEVNTQQNQEASRLASLQSLVLLKNDAKTLPFPKGKTLAVVGPHFNETSALVGNYLGQLCPGNDVDSMSCVEGVLQAFQRRNTGGQVHYAQGCSVTGTDTSGFAAALDAARRSDIVVIVAGLSTAVETEDHDRTTIDLPGVQSEFIQQIVALGKPTALVLLNGGIVALDKEKQTVPAILEAWYPGFYGADAIASAIFGDYNPGGKLPVTVYPSNYINQIKMDNMNMTEAPGRSYRFYTGTPLWEFGFGLSYTTFTIQWQNTSGIEFSDLNTEATVTAIVTNTGSVAGDEVVLAFMKPLKLANNVTDPTIKQLFGYQRVHLAAGEKTTVSFPVTAKTFKLAHLTTGDEVVHPGRYNVVLSNGVDAQVVKDVTLDFPQTVTLSRFHSW
eukprot:TRINITY_DN1015_c0_g1_i1.p1 TRINITY_DN1015_c0_g1~~TRINITY_DN1015_c0_g1_i1.p1  ORF type:complete len:776 (-),score=129.23 TRINITY_DN1015_c0_g1_i1:44-2350(-)